MLGSPGGAYANPREILWQIADTRRLAPGTGWSLYSLSNLDKIIAPIRDSLEQYGKTIAFVPQMKWIDSVAPPPPTIRGSRTASGYYLQWTQQNPSNEYLRYAVYRFARGERIDLSNPAYILAVTPEAHYVDAGAKGPCTYVVTTLDRLWNESWPSNKIAVD
jgi:hypothetical protein